jgi:hypothetical protein
MKRSMLLVLAFIAVLPLLTARPVAAADAAHAPSIWRYNAPAGALPFPRSEPAQAIWDAGACWSQCGAYCAWGETSCLTTGTQAHCIELADTCDRYCQRSCRTQGGPWFPFE